MTAAQWISGLAQFPVILAEVCYDGPEIEKRPCDTGERTGGESVGKAKDPRAKKGEDGHWERETGAAHEAWAVFETAEEFTNAAERYFAECDAAERLYSEAGLCLALSRYNAKGRAVTLKALRRWYDGEKCPYLQDAVQTVYLRIAEQIQTDSRYQEKSGMSTRAMFLMKQVRLGGYTDKPETKAETTVTILHGTSMDQSDFA